MIFAWLLALTALAGLSIQEDNSGESAEPVQEETPPAPDPPAPGSESQEPAPASSVRLVGDALRAIEADHPDLARLERVGLTRGGQEIPLLILTDLTTPLPMKRPAILFVEESGLSAKAATALVMLARRVVEGAAADERLLRILRNCAILIAPLSDPDALSPDGLPAAGAPPGGRAGVSFARNFPLGWKPETLIEGGGIIPLSAPKTMLFAQLLQEQERLAVVCGISPAYRPGTPYSGSELPAVDRKTYSELSRVAGSSALLAWSGLHSPGGSFLDYAYQARGIYALAMPFVSAPSGGSPEESWVDRTLETLIALGGRIPRLSLHACAPRRLGSGLWQLDLVLRNESLLPTLSALATTRRIPGQIGLTLEGATLVASASSGPVPSDGEVVFDGTSLRAMSDDSGVGLGTLVGGEVVHVRLIVSGASESTVAVQVMSSRGGVAKVQMLLLEEGERASVGEE